LTWVVLAALAVHLVCKERSVSVSQHSCDERRRGRLGASTPWRDPDGPGGYDVPTRTESVPASEALKDDDADADADADDAEYPTSKKTEEVKPERYNASKRAGISVNAFNRSFARPDERKTPRGISATGFLRHLHATDDD
jgi:hypothetical protein